MAKEKKQDSGWQFPKALEIVKCKEGNKEFMKERRRAYLREHGLTLCADGLRRLIISKNGGTEELKYKVCDHCGAHLDNGETCDCQKDAGESNSDEERSANNDRN